ncbi:MAG: TIGR03905 family TSCPD domain-containing protein [Clostridia bacterium]|nr:TIGR03905 family TSCPD domain-containing protein [Clostridia bacterium]
MKYTYKTKGVCSRSINLEIENGVVRNVSFEGGCNGNLQGIGQLVEGMKIDDVIERLENIKCGFKNTSCPAQLAEALKMYKAEKGD